MNEKYVNKKKLYVYFPFHNTFPLPDVVCRDLESMWKTTRALRALFIHSMIIELSLWHRFCPLVASSVQRMENFHSIRENPLMRVNSTISIMMCDVNKKSEKVSTHNFTSHMLSICWVLKTCWMRNFIQVLNFTSMS